MLFLFFLDALPDTLFKRNSPPPYELDLQHSLEDEQQNFKGEIILDDLEYKAKFELIEQKDLRVLRVSLGSSICDFRIKRISSPQEIRGGVIFANKKL